MQILVVAHHCKIICCFAAVLFSWYKDQIPNFIRSELKPYVFISGNGKLYFSSVTVDDEGFYHCLVSPPGEYASRAEGKVSMPIELKVTQTSECNYRYRTCIYVAATMVTTCMTSKNRVSLPEELRGSRWAQLTTWCISSKMTAWV